MLSVGFDQKVMDSVASAMDKANVPFRKLNTSELRTEFPMIEAPDSSSAFVEKEGGLLYADKGVQALLVKI